MTTRSESTNQPAGGRDLSLDLLKAASILLVIFFHNGQLRPGGFLDNLLMLITSAAVPCFFLASGAVFFHRPFDLNRQIRRIVRFYLVIVAWKVVYLALYRYWGAPSNGSLGALLSYLFLFQSLDGVGTAHFWFMEAMLTLMFAAPVLYLCYHTDFAPASRLPGHSRILLFLLAALFLFNQLTASAGLLLSCLERMMDKAQWGISALGEINPFSFRYSNYFTYYLLGGLLIEYKDRISARTAAVLAAAGTLGLLLIKYIQTGSFVWDGVLLQSGYYWISTMLLSCGLFLLFTRTTVREATICGRIATHAGASTLGIFYLHIPLLYLLTPALFIKLEAYNGWALNLLESVLVVLLSLPIIWAGRRIPVVRNLFR